MQYASWLFLHVIIICDHYAISETALIDRLFQVQGVQGKDGQDVRNATVRPGVRRAEHEGIRGTGKIWI